MNPIFIGGMGGSGTRAFAKVCLAADCKMGKRNPTEDAAQFIDFYNKWVTSQKYFNLSALQRKQMENEFLTKVDLYEKECEVGENNIWGAKNTRSIWALDLINKVLPDAKYIHIFKDGRDIVYRGQPTSLLKYRPRYEQQRKIEKGLSEHQFWMQFWSVHNLEAYQYGSQYMPGRYMWCRYEDLIYHSKRTLDCLSALTGLNMKKLDITKVLNMKRATKNLGKWKTFSPEKINRLNKLGYEGLVHFGYLERGWQ